jgi:hypothetical protein
VCLSVLGQHAEEEQLDSRLDSGVEEVHFFRRTENPLWFLSEDPILQLPCCRCSPSPAQGFYSSPLEKPQLQICRSELRIVFFVDPGSQ